MDVDALKNKIIKEFFDLLCKILKGYRPNYDLILLEISFIDLKDLLDEKLSLTFLQYYLNNKWQMNQS